MPWVGIVDKLKRTLIKIDCPLGDETQCTDLIPLPGYNSRSFPFLLLRNSKAINLVNTSSVSMHRLLMRQNQTGSFTKIALHIDQVNNDQIQLLFMTKNATVMEAKVENSFVMNLRDITSRLPGATSVIPNTITPN